MKILKQSTAVNLNIGPFLDATDGVTAETALTISQADVRLAKNHGAFAQKGDTNACTHLENGWYDCALSTTDTGTLGLLQVAVSESGAVPVWHEFTVVPANVYDALISGTVTISSLTASQVNAEVVDALNVDTYAEPASVPAATASLAAKIGFLMALARNKLTQTATTSTLRNDGDTSSIGTSSVADDGTTFTRSEWT